MPICGEQRMGLREVIPSLVIAAEREETLADLFVDVRRSPPVASPLIEQPALRGERFGDVAKRTQRPRDRPLRDASALRVAEYPPLGRREPELLEGFDEPTALEESPAEVVAE